MLTKEQGLTKDEGKKDVRALTLMLFTVKKSWTIGMLKVM